MLQLVDNSFIYDKHNTLKLGLTTAVELSYLNIDEQNLLYYVIGYVDATPSRAQSIRIRNMFLKDKVTFDKLEKILSEEKGNQREQISFNKNNIGFVFPPELLKRDKRYIEKYIIEAIKKYKKR